MTLAVCVGEQWMQHGLQGLSLTFPRSAVGLPFFSEQAAHLLMAAADYLIIPSRFEPCGLVALCALRYGTVPIAAATGGLCDIVTPQVRPLPLHQHMSTAGWWTM